MKMSHDKFEVHRKSVLTELKKRELNLEEKAERFWDNIWQHDLEFNFKDELGLKILETVTLKDVQKFFDHYFVTNSQEIEI